MNLRSLPGKKSFAIALGKNAGVLGFFLTSVFASAQTISPTLVANNLWYASEVSGAIPSDTVLAAVKDQNTKLVRIGGAQFDKAMPSQTIMEAWVLKIRSLGAEPIIQVSQYSSATSYANRATAAAEMVKYLNVTKKLGVKYWSIGNEPWLQAGAPSSHTAVIANVSAYIKEISPAMKAVDPTIKILGPDEAYLMTNGSSDAYDEFFTTGGSYDIGGLVPGKTYYYLDGISWHKYPQNTNDPATANADLFLADIKTSKALVDAANAKHNRTGANALIWGLGEYNSEYASQVYTFSNGQMFAQVLGYAMKYEATYAATWSMMESSGTRTGSDKGMFDGITNSPRSSGYHMGLISKYFSGSYADGTSSNSDIVSFGSVNGSVRSVIVMNRGSTTPNFTLRLNTDTIATTDVKINVNAGSTQQYSSVIGPYTTLVFVFNGNSITKITYSKAMADSALSPTEETITVAGSSSSAVASSVTSSSKISSSSSSSSSSSLASSSVVSTSKSSSSVASSSVVASSKSSSSVASSAASSSSIASSAASTNKCDYVVTSEWNSGFTADIRITNNSTSVINGWTVGWAYSEGSSMTNGWNATFAGTNPYTAKNLDWNGTIQPGQTVIIGFQGAKGVMNAAAAVPKVTGSVCP